MTTTAAAAAGDVRGNKTYLATFPAEPVAPLPRKGTPRQLMTGYMVASLALGAAGAPGQQGEVKTWQLTVMTCVWTKKS
jgi:hypothetical protein